jgi:hypothetical protein
MSRRLLSVVPLKYPYALTALCLCSSSDYKLLLKDISLDQLLVCVSRFLADENSFYSTDAFLFLRLYVAVTRDRDKS